MKKITSSEKQILEKVAYMMSFLFEERERANFILSSIAEGALSAGADFERVRKDIRKIAHFAFRYKERSIEVLNYFDKIYWEASTGPRNSSLKRSLNGEKIEYPLEKFLKEMREYSRVNRRFLPPEEYIENVGAQAFLYNRRNSARYNSREPRMGKIYSHNRLVTRQRQKFSNLD